MTSGASPVGAAFACKIIEMANSADMDHGVTSSELSWILEINKDMLTDMGEGLSGRI